jgi:hypothetical protein
MTKYLNLDDWYDLPEQFLSDDARDRLDHMPETGEQEPTQLPVLPASGGLERGY